MKTTVTLLLIFTSFTINAQGILFTAKEKGKG